MKEQSKTRIINDTNEKKDHRLDFLQGLKMANKHMQIFSCHKSSGKCKSKPQQDTSWLPLGWLESNSQIIASVGEDAENWNHCTLLVEI